MQAQRHITGAAWQRQGIRLPRKFDVADDHARQALAGRNVCDAAVDGRSTVRLSYGQVFDRPCQTAGKLAQVLQRHGMAVAGHPCGAELIGGQIPVAVGVRGFEGRLNSGAQLLLVEHAVAVRVDGRSSRLSARRENSPRGTEEH